MAKRNVFNAPFNIEFFWDAGRDRVWLLEVNTRISESHCDLFEKVDDTSSHEVAVDLALGRKPAFRKEAGEFTVAGNFFLRAYCDARVERVPGPEEVRRIEEAVPGTIIQIQANPGDRLSDMMDQDSYTFCLALVFIGGDSQKDLLEKYRRVEAALDFRLDQSAAA